MWPPLSGFADILMLGRVVSEFENETIRELVVGNYRVVYRLRGQRVGVIAVVYGSRDLLKRISREPWVFE